MAEVHSFKYNNNNIFHDEKDSPGSVRWSDLAESTSEGEKSGKY